MSLGAIYGQGEPATFHGDGIPKGVTSDLKKTSVGVYDYSDDNNSENDRVGGFFFLINIYMTN